MQLIFNVHEDIMYPCIQTLFIYKEYVFITCTYWLRNPYFEVKFPLHMHMYMWSKIVPVVVVVCARIENFLMTSNYVNCFYLFCSNIFPACVYFNCLSVYLLYTCAGTFQLGKEQNMQKLKIKQLPFTQP